MTKKSQKNLTDAYLEAADYEFLAGSMTEKEYHKTLLKIASEYLVSNADEEGCLRTLSMVPEAFIQNELAGLIEEDSQMAISMLELAHHLERRGITWEGVVKPTQNEAKA